MIPVRTITIRSLNLFYLPLILVFAFLLSGCSNKYIDRVDRAENFSYTPGEPELRISATGYITPEDSTKLIVTTDIVYGSLIYSLRDDALQADVVLNIQVNNRSDDKNVVSHQYEYSIRGEDQSINVSQDVYSIEKEYYVEPGEFEVSMAVTDRTTGKTTIRETETFVPDPEGIKSSFTGIRILGKSSDTPGEDFKSINTYGIPSRYDSLLFSFQLNNKFSNEPVRIQTRLLKFDSDTSIARRMNYNNYSPGNIEYKGIDYDDFEVLQSTQRTINQQGSILIEYIFNDLGTGNYRLEVKSVDDEKNLYRAADFAMHSENFPSLETARELARPLYYLMDKGEYEELMSIEDDEELKKAIDTFWLSNVQNSVTARNVIQLYYERVENANKQFSNFKEGWKTDPGMIYILFGEPWYSDRYGPRLEWSYAYDRSDPEKNFTFRRTKVRSKYFPFYNYLLQRDSFYQNIQFNQIQRWLRGSILFPD